MILYVKLEYLQKYSRSVYWNVITQMRLDDKFTTVECAGPMFVPPPIYSLTSHTLLLKPSQPHKSPESCAILYITLTTNKSVALFTPSRYSSAVLACFKALLLALSVHTSKLHAHTHTHTTHATCACVCAIFHFCLCQLRSPLEIFIVRTR
jgi:hypothetical protein